MKLAFLFCLIISFSFSVSAFEKKSQLFSLEDEELVNMDQLDELEAYVLSHEGITYDEVKEQKADLVANVSNATVLFGGVEKDYPFGIPPFLWGCLLGPIGILLVYAASENAEYAREALLGCLGGIVISVLFALIFSALTLGTIY